MTSLYSCIVMISIFMLSFGCDEKKVVESYSKATADEIPEIIMGSYFDSSKVHECSSLLDQEYAQGLCVLLHDGFERDTITADSVFNWDVLIMDNGYDGSDVDATIESVNHLGHTIEGSRAVLFRGRQGGSTHEIYLVSRPLDLTNFDQLYIQFRYIPIGLEQEITLSWSGERVAEAIRVDVCHDSDFHCGLEGDNSYLRIRDNTSWDNYFLSSFNSGENLNIKNYVEQDWKLGQILIDLDSYQERKDNIVFKIAVSMDEGYIDNDHNKLMEDGLILDDFLALGVVKIEF